MEHDGTIAYIFAQSAACWEITRVRIAGGFCLLVPCCSQAIDCAKKPGCWWTLKHSQDRDHGMRFQRTLCSQLRENRRSVLNLAEQQVDLLWPRSLANKQRYKDEHETIKDILYNYIYTPFTRDGLLPMILGEVLANSMGKSNILREVSGQLYSQRPLFQWPSWHATKWQKPKKHQCFSKIRQKDGVSSLAEIALARKAHSG